MAFAGVPRSKAKVRIRSLLMSVIAIGTVACRASYPAAPTDDSVPVAFYVLHTQTFGFAAVGSTYSFLAYTLTSDGAYEDVTSRTTWVSSDAGVLRPGATVAAFAAVASGPVEVVARHREFVHSIPMFVIRPDRQPYPYLSISAGAPRTLGEASQAVARVQQSATVSQVVTDFATWASSNPGVATVNRGLVTAVSTGTTQITASYDGLSAFYNLSVRPRR
jgi:hypothetical protein